eukprot:TRINITY_DN18223_c0_g1_i7.p1 TRINITY_DN18223_c0_g1~~TRINITY_DN18223_c0_g1_i7.p1  ORF type:complete len:1100 (+),score=474.36 TRINITY_DN18223_c0_g1_i7:128-3427(+)
MSQHAIREFDGKNILARWLSANSEFQLSSQFVQIRPDTDLEELPVAHPWLLNTRLVVKPDQLIKRRGKSGLLKLNATWPEAAEWLQQHRGQSVQVDHVTGILNYFIVEPFLPHTAAEEMYVCIQSDRNGDEILFHHEGGVDIGDVDAKANRYTIAIDAQPTIEEVTASLLGSVPADKQERIAKFLLSLFELYCSLHFAYLEINPLVVTNEAITPLDLAAKLDECAKFECGKSWGAIDFPPPFGRPLLPAEEYIAELDSKTGASLKLTVLNSRGRIWTMVAGGGASVIYADTIVDLGAGAELANYGEYSGDPTEALTFEYAKTILSLMTQHHDERGKILLIGGGIANFTNVAETFKGIIRAITQFSDKLAEHNISIYVRRGGPNYEEGLNRMRSLGASLNLPIHVFGPESHITSIVALALGKPLPSIPIDTQTVNTVASLSGLDRRASLTTTPAPLPLSSPSASPSSSPRASRSLSQVADFEVKDDPCNLFTVDTKALVYGMQPSAVQNMLDFDFICSRSNPSVVGVVYEFSPSHHRKFYWGSQEIMLPVHNSLESALQRHPNVSVIVSFASSRSVFESTKEMLKFPQIKTIAIIAEGVPERRTRQLIRMAALKQVTVVGPATVGGIKAGVFRIGNTGGMLDNIIASKLYRPGSVAYVSRSGGLSNELNNIIGRYTDGVYEGIAIGGDRYPGTLFIDHIMRYQANPQVKMIVLLGEVGGTAEYEVVEAMKRGQITKPVVAWCTGTCAKVFPYEVQFGHAGALAHGQSETADAKNLALRLAGAVVPNSFQDFHLAIYNTFQTLLQEGKVVLKPEPEPPKIPVDYEWARKLGLIRKSASFVSTISDERGEELMYAGMPISRIFETNLGVGGVLGLLWFRKRLPEYACRFIEMVLMVTADHGPAVAGAHNTIVTARAGKDLISSLVSGLLTIGPRFGGALDDAASKFTWAFDKGLSPDEFVDFMRKEKELIPGIGHKKKSLQNPDRRVQLTVDYVKQHFPSTELLDYALAVEKITTRKKSNLILNVDGCIAVAFVDLLRGSGIFTKPEADEYLQLGCLNGLFVLGRSIGFIGHYIDQKRLKQGLYRHPDEDIAYLNPDEEFSF